MCKNRLKSRIRAINRKHKKPTAELSRHFLTREEIVLNVIRKKKKIQNRN